MIHIGMLLARDGNHHRFRLMLSGADKAAALVMLKTAIDQVENDEPGRRTASS